MTTRALPLLFVAAVAVSAGGQPPDPKGEKAKGPAAAYTAFPDLKPPAAGKAVELPPVPAEPADASPLRKVQFAQLREGLAYLALASEATRVGARNSADADEVRVAGDVYRLAGDLETDPAKRAAWYEARVRRLKLAEQTAERQFAAGVGQPQAVHAAAFARLQAEVDLLKVKAEGEKAPRK